MSFSSMGLSQELLDSVKKFGFKTPTPIQVESFKPLKTKNSFIASAPTGSGKTIAYALPLIDMLEEKEEFRHVQILILVPTRELSVQVFDTFEKLTEGMDRKVIMLSGGSNIDLQKKAIREGADIVIATVGRLKDLISRKEIVLNRVAHFVLDEADTMLDMGFMNDVLTIRDSLRDSVQTVMFSAAFTTHMNSLTQEILVSPTRIDLSAKAGAKSITQKVIRVDEGQKAALLAYLIGDNQWNRVLVFCRTKEAVDNLVEELQLDGIKCEAFHGDKTQAKRTKILEAFKASKITALVATDIAARGIDIEDLDYVVNHTLPHKPAEYIHRIGRTGRAGKVGQAYSLVGADDYRHLKDITKVVGKKIEIEIIEGFEPQEKPPILSKNGKGIGKTKKKDVGGAFGKKKSSEPKKKKPKGKRSAFGY